MQMTSHSSNKLDSNELRGFNRSMTELQWLLLILVVLYYFIPTDEITEPESMIAIMVGYAGFVLLFRYVAFRVQETRFKMALETWAMIGFITGILWHTGYIESPLLNLYLLVIVACAITLGRVMTLLEIVMIASCYLYMGFHLYSVDVFRPETFTILMAHFSPFLLVAYVTSMLADDIISARKKIMILSHTDELTGLLNLRAFNLLLEKEIARVKRNKQPFTMLMIDVDGLKQVNDHYGHSAGSRLIKTVARAIEGVVRESDILARYGGDEFIVLLPGTGIDSAHLCAERIRTAVSNCSFDVSGRRVSATTSIGIASYPDSAAEAQAVLDKADMALYRSKQNGRNCVTRYATELEPVLACA